MTRWLWLLLAVWPVTVDAACRHALVLALDVSASVDRREYRLQRDGVALALTQNAVRDLLLAPGAAPVRLLVFEWSSPEDQVVILPWTVLTDDAALTAAAAQIRAHRRQIYTPTTALGTAMRVGLDHLADQPTCWKHTLDISGDGQANTGLPPSIVTLDGAPAGTVINALVIGADDRRGGDDRSANVRELSSYFRRNIIRGPGAFVEVALGFDDYATAMERKLIRELGVIAIGAAQ